MYNKRAPALIDIIEMKVPIHFPNKIPEMIKSGDPKPNKDIHIKQNKKKNNRFKKRFELTDLSKSICNCLQYKKSLRRDISKYEKIKYKNVNKIRM